MYVDGTFGRGGHSRAILARLGPPRPTDRPGPGSAARCGQPRDSTDPRFAIRHASFSQLARVLRELGVARVDGVLLDLGVSSPQLEDPRAASAFVLDGPLDMRMDTKPRHDSRAMAGGRFRRAESGR